LERRLLAVYEELYRCPYSDTKNYVLEGLYEVLQSHGEEVGPAWPIVLALIKGVAQDEEEHHVRQAFMCVQLVRNDLLSVLPVDCLQLLLTTIGAYGCQGSDLNISLTAITLLMNIADFFSRERLALLAAFCEEGFQPPGLDPSPKHVRSKVHNVDQLWLVLYHQLRLLAVDARIEVRHSSLRSLFTTLETHSLVLEDASWGQVVHELLLPVLDQVRDCACASSSSDEPLEKVLGPAGGGVGTEQGKGGQQMLLIHHSRNTQSKQWDGTWETALQGVIRIFLTGFKLWSGLRTASEAWGALMGHVEQAILHGSPKVASAAIQAIKALILAHAQNLPQDMWDAFNATAQRTVTGATVEAEDKRGGGGGGGQEKKKNPTKR